MSGGRTTAVQRWDVALGGSARVAYAELQAEAAPSASPQRVLALAQPQGVAPFGAFRKGLSSNTDLGVLCAPFMCRADLKFSHTLRDKHTWVGVMAAPGPYLGTLRQLDNDAADVNGLRTGLELPLLLGVDFGGIYETWLGLRMSAEWAQGSVRLKDEVDSTQSDVSALGVRGGAVWGVGVGFRRVHALVELSAHYEWWDATVEDNNATLGGWVLTPAFALRLRM